MNRNKLQEIISLTLKQAAAASAVISVAAAVALAFVYFSGSAGNIKDSPQIDALKQEIEKYPDDKTLVNNFREVDFQERSRFFSKTALLETGKRICAGFFLLALLSIRGYSMLRKKLPEAKKGSEGYNIGGNTAGNVILISSCITALIIVFLLVFISMTGLKKFPWQAKEAVKAEIKINKAEKEQWAGFRGSSGLGLAAAGDLSMNWTAVQVPKSGEEKTYGNILAWKIELPVKAYSSPIVFKDSVFITGSGEKKLKVLCFSASNGKLNWSSTVLVKTNIEDMEVLSEENGGAGYASPTPVTDGEYVYAYFATNQLVCFDFSGKQQWLKFFGKPENTYGLSSSPLLFEDKILLQVDQSAEGMSRLYAVNKKSGEIAWETKRPDGSSWGTPVIIDYKGKKQLVTTGAEWVIAYEPETGKELWRADCLSGDVSTSPAYADEKIFVMDTGTQTAVFAIDPGGAGDVTKTNIVWKHEEESQAINAPVAAGSKLIIALNGLIVCHDTADGKILWQRKLEDDFWASPETAGNLVFIPSQKGKIYVFDLDGNPVAAMDTGEKISASMAFCGGSAFIRTEKSLLCLRDGKNK